MSKRKLKGSRPPEEVEDINRRTWKSDHTFITSTPAKPSKMSERGEIEKRLFLPYAEILWRRYAYMHRKDDGRFPSRNEYIAEVLDKAAKEIYRELHSVATIWDFKKVEQVIEKWFGKPVAQVNREETPPT